MKRKIDRAHLVEIGRIGGKKSRRKLSKRDARAMAKIRWDKHKLEREKR